MGHGDPNAGNPTLHVTIVDGEFIYRIELSVGMELGGLGHVATNAAEHLTEAYWFACLAAAPQGWAALAAVLYASPAATWIDRVITKANYANKWPSVRALLLKRFSQTWAPLNTKQALDAHRWLLAA